MALPLTQHSLDKMEQLLKALDFTVRYEKGNFKTAACLLESNRVIVINKFSNLETKILMLAALIPTLTIDETLLEQKQTAFLYSLKQTKFTF